MAKDCLAFLLSYCMRKGASLRNSGSEYKLLTEITAIGVEKDITSRKMIKKGLIENMTDFIQTLNKLSSKKRRQINKSNLIVSIGESSLKKLSFVISITLIQKNYQFLYKLKKLKA